ncbi:MAG: OmpA family protein [Bradymonadaceae bacterium]
MFSPFSKDLPYIAMVCRGSTFRFVALAALAIGLVCPAVASAQSAGFRYKVKSGVEKGKGKPSLILRATDDITDAKVKFERSDGKTFTKSLGAMSRGDSKTIPVDQPAGTYAYTIHLSGKGKEGEEIDTTFEAKMSVVEPLEVWVKKDAAQVAEGKLTMEGSRPIAKVHIAVFDENGAPIHEQMKHLGGKRGQFQLTWESNKKAAAIKLKAYDKHGFWRGMKLEPFWVEIPHDEVRFKFGEASWKDEEISKLEKSLERIREAMDKHGDKGLKMQLYIAGYTDTVGSQSSNRTLSRKRARAIGRWFRKNGLDIPVYYQGFGEDVLAVETPDETRNKKNRRAVYILGNARPPTSETIPRSNWKKLEE